MKSPMTFPITEKVRRKFTVPGSFGGQEGFMKISTIGIDLSKTRFHVSMLNARGKIVLRRKISACSYFTSN